MPSRVIRAMLDFLGDLIGFFDVCLCGLWDSPSGDDDGDWKPLV